MEREVQLRKEVSSMSDRELLEECVVNQRAASDLIEKFISDFGNNPMLRNLGRMFGGG